MWTPPDGWRRSRPASCWRSTGSTGVYLNAPDHDVAGNHARGAGLTISPPGSRPTRPGRRCRLTNPQKRRHQYRPERQGRRCSSIGRSTPRPSASAFASRPAASTVPGTYVLEDGQRRIRFTPAAPLAAAGTAYTVTLTNELRDIAGNSLTNPGSSCSPPGPRTTRPRRPYVASTPAYNDSNVGLHAGHPRRLQRADQSDHGEPDVVLPLQPSTMAYIRARSRSPPIA